MGNEITLKPKISIKSSDVARFLKAKVFGNNLPIKTVSSLNDVKANSLTFSKNKISFDFSKGKKHICVITTQLPDKIGSNAFIIVDNPRLAFAEILKEFFVEKRNQGIGEYTFIHPTAKIARGVSIGNGCAIGENVVIGANTEIYHNVTIADNVKIGQNCRIKSGTVIGEKGFGFEFEKNGTPVEFPHLKSVKIGSNVEIGALNTVVGGALQDTIIQSHVKTDDHVHIAHNCFVGAKTVITACAEISGSVIIGKKCWLGPNCSIMNKINIGNDCLIGLGAVVLKDVPSGAVMAGNPAKILRIK